MSKETTAKSAAIPLKYVGPVSNLHLTGGTGAPEKDKAKGATVPLITGEIYPGKTFKKPLPVDHPVVASLISRKLLVTVIAETDGQKAE